MASSSIARFLTSYEREQRRRRAIALIALAIGAVLLWGSAASIAIEPAPLVENIAKLPSYFVRLFTLPDGEFVFRHPRVWLWGLPRWSRLLIETVCIAYLATALGGLGAFVTCFFASKATNASSASRVLVIRLYEVARTVPEVVSALLLVLIFGFGATAGVLALAINGFGAIGRLLLEAADNLPDAPLEAVRAVGGASIHVAVFGRGPQLVPAAVGYALLRLESNVRSATVLGFVGAGGIGQDLLEAIRKFYYNDAAAMLSLIFMLVVGVNVLSGWLRKRIVVGSVR